MFMEHTTDQDTPRRKTEDKVYGMELARSQQAANMRCRLLKTDRPVQPHPQSPRGMGATQMCTAAGHSSGSCL